MVNNIGDDENKMVSYKVVLWLLAVLLMLGWGTKVYADAMQAQDTLGDDGTLFLYAGAAVLIDADTGQVLYGKNEHSRMEPASLTKIMTCLLAMEHSDPQEPVTATAESLNLPLDASVLGLYEGETMTMEQMLYAMMLPSANDAANAVGVHIAGSLSAFAQMMNEKAQELGLVNTHYVNCTGFDEDGHQRLLRNSFLLSCDNGHGIHPNHPELADGQEAPVLGGGVVVKHSPRYATEGMASAVFTELCRRASVPVQHYSNRPDQAGGSTLGNILSGQVSVPSVDIGLAQLAMHSAYETAGVFDLKDMIRLAQEFYSSDLMMEP